MKQFTKQQIEAAVLRVVAERGGVPATDLTRETHFRDDLNFDSLDLVELTMSLEEEFELSIPDGEAEKLITVGEVVDCVVERSQNAASPA
ncbi:MAG TPA: acyl carrier protein [Tepidisphaeraceae bacterium]|nr:acyl carrier protein [Tepidisphaeraceae bacterium]